MENGRGVRGVTPKGVARLPNTRKEDRGGRTAQPPRPGSRVWVWSMSNQKRWKLDYDLLRYLTLAGTRSENFATTLTLRNQQFAPLQIPSKFQKKNGREKIRGLGGGGVCTR